MDLAASVGVNGVGNVIYKRKGNTIVKLTVDTPSQKAAKSCLLARLKAEMIAKKAPLMEKKAANAKSAKARAEKKKSAKKSVQAKSSVNFEGNKNDYQKLM